MARFFIILITLISISFCICNAQTFEKIVIEAENGVYNGECRWFDYDGDNDLDFIITGQVETNTLRMAIYENTGNDTFEQDYSSQGFSETGLAFINLDRDEDTDFLLFGRSIGVDNDLQIYQLEDGDIEIVDNLIPEFLSGGGYGSVIYADINNDLLQDVFITGINGYDEGDPVIEAHFYWQNDDGSFSYNSALDNAVYLADAVLFDVDNDHDLDLFISGSDNVYPYQRTELLLNTDGTFTLDEESTFTQLQNTSIDIGDYDNDGDPDIIMIGLDAHLDPYTVLYKNTIGVFAAVESSGLSDHHGLSGSVMWGDYDNDNDLDLLMGGDSSGDYAFELMVNQGDGTFERLDETNFENLSYGSVAWGDYDGDGDLDILATGYVEGEAPQIIVYKNKVVSNATVPEVPDNLMVDYDGESVTLSWNGDLNARQQVTSELLTYNLHIENADEQPLLYSFSDLSTGFRKIVAMGNTGYSTSWTFKDLDEGMYKWKVQSIGPSFMASEFSEESYFVVGQPDLSPSPFSAEIEIQGVKLDWNDNNSNEENFIVERKVSDAEGFVEIGSTAYNVDSYLDKAEGLPPAFNATYKVYAENWHGQSEYSASAQVWYNGKPTDLTVGQIGTGVALTWKDNSFNEEEFVIERMEDGEEGFTQIGTANKGVTIYIDKDKVDGYTATYRVFAANTQGASDTSKEETFTVLDAGDDLLADFSVFPNPASGQVTIDLGSVKPEQKQVKILNSAGQLRHVGKMNGTSKELSLVGLPDGIYYLSVEGYPVRKLIKR